MRVFLGMILGILLTIAVAYINDHVTAGSFGSTIEVVTTDSSGHPVTTTTDTTTRKPWVNWDIVDSDWPAYGPGAPCVEPVVGAVQQDLRSTGLRDDWRGSRRPRA